MRWSSFAPVAVLCLAVLGACGDDHVGAGDTDDGSSDSGPPMMTTMPPDGTTDDTVEPEESSDDGDETTGPPACEDEDCDDGNPCTVSTCGNNGMCSEAQPVASNACRPQIEVDFPPRAATLADASPIVTVTGTVTSGAGPIAWLELNGEDVTVEADGSFSHDISAVTGGNLLVFETEDVFEVARDRVQSFLWSPSYRLPTTPDVGIADEAVGIYLDQEVIDDGDHSAPPDDLATLLSLAIASIDLEQFIPPGYIYQNTTLGYRVYVTGIDYASTSLSLDSDDGGAHLTASINGIVGDLLYDCYVGPTSPPCFNADDTGGFSASSITGEADLVITVNAQNELQITTTNVITTVNDFDVWTDNGIANAVLTFVEPYIIDGIVSDIEGLIEDQIEGTLGPALTSALTGLTPESALVFPNIADATDPIQITLATDFYDADFHDGATPPNPSPPQGGVITLRGGGYPTEIVTPYENFGIPTRANCGEGGGGITLPRTGDLEIGIHDDLLNQLLNAAWRGGLLEFEMPEELLPANTDLIGDLQLTVSAMLAPTASDCGDDGVVRAHLGDVRIDGSLLLNGTPTTFTSYSSMIANLEFTTTANGVAITIDDVERIATELTVHEDGQDDAEAVLEPALEAQLVDGLIDAISEGGLGEISIPEIDLSLNLGLPAGTAAVQVTPDSVDRQPGTTVITGHL